MPKKKKRTSPASEAARALNRARWSKVGKAERKKIAEELARARKAIPPEVREAIAKKAAAARWGKKKVQPPETEP